MEAGKLRIIQISDTHLYADAERDLLGVKTQESFRAVVELLRQNETATQLILLSGDLSQDYTEGSYIRLAEMLKPFQIPVYYVPGNHDDPKMMTHVYPRETFSNHKHVILKNWQIILLNSHVSKSVAGSLDVSQLAYMQHCLQAYPEHRAIIMFHHQPIPVGCEWLDKLGLLNADEFWKIAAHYPNIHTVLFGHVHQEFSAVKNNVHCYSAPSTCIQFKRKQNNFGLEELPPGYRWIDLYDDGRLETAVVRVAHYVGVFDGHAKGY